MLLYVQSKSFPCKSFVVTIKPNDTVARVRAHILHVLHRYKRDDHQFQLRFNRQFLRDSYTIDDYRIGDNSIIKMVPMSKRSDSTIDLMSTSSFNSLDEQGSGQSPKVKAALAKEIKTFQWREEMVKDFKALMYFLLVLSPLAGFTMYFYAVSWCFLVPLIGVLWCPTYTRFAGYVGVNTIYKTPFCVVFGVLSLGCVAAAVFLAFKDIAAIVITGCANSLDGCTSQLFFSAMFYTLHCMLMLLGSGLAWAMLYNFQIQIGDIVEKYLVQTRDIEKLIQIAKTGKVKEKRIAVFDLATLAASGDDSKYKIVSAGGLEVLISMILSSDESTQEHVVDCTAELLTIPEMQEKFIDEGGLRSLMPVLRSNNEHLVYEAAIAISFIAAENEENKLSVSSDHGLEDLCHAANNGSLSCQRIVAGIFLELAFSPVVRMNMSAMNSPAQALIKMCKSTDLETQRYALQALELLAIESAEMICAQEELLPVLLNLPSTSPDEKLYVLAAKLLLYYAEDTNSCKLLLSQSNLHSSLSLYAQTQDPIVQKVISKMICCIIKFDKDMRLKSKEMKYDQILRLIKDQTNDRETWDIADQALQVLEGKASKINLPKLNLPMPSPLEVKKSTNGSLEPKPGTSFA